MIGGPTVQHVEIGYALLNETNDLGIHDHAAFDASSFLYDARVALRPVGTIHCEQAHTPIADVDLQSIAIMLQLMRPARTGCTSDPTGTAPMTSNLRPGPLRKLRLSVSVAAETAPAERSKAPTANENAYVCMLHLSRYRPHKFRTLPLASNHIPVSQDHESFRHQTSNSAPRQK
jgi:hypothetical protein